MAKRQPSPPTPSRPTYRVERTGGLFFPVEIGPGIEMWACWGEPKLWHPREIEKGSVPVYETKIDKQKPQEPLRIPPSGILRRD